MRGKKAINLVFSMFIFFSVLSFWMNENNPFIVVSTMKDEDKLTVNGALNYNVIKYDKITQVEHLTYI